MSCVVSLRQDRLRVYTGARVRYRVQRTAVPKGLRTRFRLALLGRNPSVPCQGSIYQKSALLEPLVYCPERSDGATLVEGRRLSCVVSLRQDRLRACTGGASPLSRAAHGGPKGIAYKISACFAWPKSVRSLPGGRRTTKQPCVLRTIFLCPDVFLCKRRPPSGHKKSNLWLQGCLVVRDNGLEPLTLSTSRRRSTS